MPPPPVTFVEATDADSLNTLRIRPFRRMLRRLGTVACLNFVWNEYIDTHMQILATISSLQSRYYRRR